MMVVKTGGLKKAALTFTCLMSVLLMPKTAGQWETWGASFIALMEVKLETPEEQNREYFKRESNLLILPGDGRSGILEPCSKPRTGERSGYPRIM